MKAIQPKAPGRTPGPKAPNRSRSTGSGAAVDRAEVDAKVFYAEAGLEIRGHWRAADGSVGSVVGTKALAGLA